MCTDTEQSPIMQFNKKIQGIAMCVYDMLLFLHTQLGK